MSEDLIDRGKKTTREYVIQLLDEMDSLKDKIEKQWTVDFKDLEKEVQKIKINMAVLQAKAAALGAIGGAVLSALITYLMK